MTAPALTYFSPDFGRAHDFPATELFINNTLALAFHPVALSPSKTLPHETKRTTRAQHTNPQRVHTTAMRPNSIISISALAAGSLASGAHDVDNLLARPTDHKMMDPARLSVLSVLKTAIASGSAFPRPTGDFEPEWYQKLPEEVKHILPSLYPAAAADVSASPPMSTTTVVPASTSNPPSTSQATVTKTLQHAPSGAAGLDLTSSASSSMAVASTNGTVLPVPPSPSLPASGSVRTVMRVEKLAGLAWIGLAAGFVLFA